MIALRILKKTVFAFLANGVTVQAAALAYYTALSLAPLLVLLLWVAGLLGPGAQSKLILAMMDLVGEDAGQVVALVIHHAASHPNARTAAGVVGMLALVFAASGVFSQIQTALNRIWSVEARPEKQLVGWLRKRLISIGMVLVIGFLILVSTAASAALSGILAYARDRLPGSAFAWSAANLVFPLLIMILLFAAMYRILPDARIPWNQVWLGAAVTSVLFSAGKWLIGLYLGRSTVGSAYGAAGSLIALLVWVYYSAIVLFFGAQLTRVWAERNGLRVIPEPHAARTEEPKKGRRAA